VVEAAVVAHRATPPSFINASPSSPGLGDPVKGHASDPKPDGLGALLRNCYGSGR
jgi:hypothetical protein